jgi:hypothetical protein
MRDNDLPLYMLNDFNGQKLDSFYYNFWAHFWSNFRIGVAAVL